MEAISCHVLDCVTDRAAVGMAIHLMCLTHKTELNAREFGSKILDTGENEKWELLGKGHLKISLEAFIAGICKNEPSKWHLVCGAGKYYGRDRTSWPIVGLFFILRKGEWRSITLSLSPHQFNAYTCVNDNPRVKVIEMFLQQCC